jgi:hypothetical protein
MSGRTRLAGRCRHAWGGKPRKRRESSRAEQTQGVKRTDDIGRVRVRPPCEPLCRVSTKQPWLVTGQRNNSLLVRLDSAAVAEWVTC